MSHVFSGSKVLPKKLYSIWPNKTLDCQIIRQMATLGKFRWRHNNNLGSDSCTLKYHILLAENVFCLEHNPLNCYAYTFEKAN